MERGKGGEDMSKWIDDIVKVAQEELGLSGEDSEKLHKRLEDLVLVVRFE